MPVRQLTITTSPTEICSPHAGRRVLIIKNCTGIGVPTGEYFRLSDNKDDVKVSDKCFLMEPGDVLILMTLDGDHPEKAWWGQSATGNSCCCVIESYAYGA